MGKRKTVTVGYRIYLGLLLGWCHGVPDKLLRLRADDRDLWVGAATTEQALTVDKEGLFGGDTSEGGMSGTVRYMPGLPTQTASAYLQTAVSEEMPAHRGVVTTVFQKFYIGTSAYLKKLSAKLQRIYLTVEGDAQWYPEKAGIPSPNELNTDAAVFREQFSDWPTPYTTLTESSHFSIVSTPYGNGLKLTNTVDEGNDGRAIRPVPELQYQRISFKARIDVNAAGSDSFDADLLTVIFNESGQSALDALYVHISRDATGTGSNERPAIRDVPIGAAPLVVGDWYQFDFILDWDTKTADYTVTKLSDGTVFASGTTTAWVIDTINEIQFEGDIAPSERLNDAATIADIRLYPAGVMEDMNPAHIIRECLTSPEWGLGYTDDDIDADSFEAAADRLFLEDFGLSIEWSTQTPLEQFIEEIRKHIDAALYLDPSTGKFVLKLIRDDYDVGDLEVFNEDNIESVTDYTQRQPDQLINSVVVKYEDNGTDKPATREAQDIAQIQMQGKVISSTVNYPGVPNAELAGRLAARDLRALSSPLISCTIHVSPASGRNLRIGQPIVLEWPDYGVYSVVMRVTGLTFGDGVTNKVRVALVQDVFSTPAVSYTISTGSEWTDVSTEPVPVSDQIVFEAPYYAIAREFGEAAINAALTADAELGYVCAAAPQPTGAIKMVMAVDDGLGYDELAEPGNFAPCCTIDDTIDRSDEVWNITAESGFTTLTAGDYGQIDDELVKVVSKTDTTLTVKRGMLDTVPANHTSGARLFVWSRGLAIDETERITGDEIAVKLLPVTGRGTLPIGSAAEMTITLANRAIRPYPPGNVKVNDEAFPTALTGALTVTWAHRDRTQQTGADLVEQDETDIGPETGVTYRLRVLDADTDDVLYDVGGLDGTSHEVDDALLAGSANITIQLWSVKTNSSAAALGAAFDILTGDPLLVYRFLLASGGRVDIVYNTTMSGNYYSAHRYSAAGVLEDSLNCRQVSCASYDATGNLLVIGTRTIPLTDPAELWFIDTSVAGLVVAAAIEPDFPTPSGNEIIYAVAAGGNVIAVNYDHSRIIKYDADGTELLQVDEALSSAVFDYDGVNLIFSISGGHARFDPADLTHIADVTYSPSATPNSPQRLIDGEVVFIDTPLSSGVLYTLYRYNVTTGARIASYADGGPLHSNGLPSLAFFDPYLSIGDVAADRLVYDVTDWSLVASSGGAASLESWQRQELTFGYTP